MFVALEAMLTREGGGMGLSFRQDPTDAMALYRERGYHIEENLVPSDMIDRVIAVALDWPNAREGVFGPIPMPHRVHPVFMEMMRFAPIVDVVERIVGGTATGLGGEFFYMKPGTPGFASHQDNAYVAAPPDAFMSVWTALCDVDAENGSLVFYPGSHKLGALPTREVGRAIGPGQNPGAQAVECVMPNEFEGVPMVLRRGSTVFFHSQTVHSSNENRSDRFRYAFLATYLRKGEPFRAGTAQKRTPVELHG
jgi:Phytanoyl-CoA dioxygenase (PhyH)